MLMILISAVLLLVPLVISLVILRFVSVVGRMLPAKADKI